MLIVGRFPLQQSSGNGRCLNRANGISRAVCLVFAGFANAQDKPPDTPSSCMMTASPSITAERHGSSRKAAAMPGMRSAQSRPDFVTSRTSSRTTWAWMRESSCLIS